MNQLFKNQLSNLMLVGVLSVVVLCSCTDIETENLKSGISDSYFNITVTIPGAQNPSTRTIADEKGEAKVTTVDLLIFEDTGAGETLSQHLVGENITQSTSNDDKYKVRFIARLATNPNATTIAIIANAAKRISAAAKIGSYKADVLGALTFVSDGLNIPYKWNATSSTNYTPIPMYGEYNVEEGGITHFTTVENVELIRMLARIDVVNNDSNFKITNVQVVNYQTAGYIAPTWSDVKPMIPSTSVHRTGTSNTLKYSTSITTTVGTIYTYEAPASTGEEGAVGHTNAMCLIVEGKYNDNTYYYRIDFTNPKDSAGIMAGHEGFDPSRVGYIPVLRNHLYRFTINEVGAGHKTIASAFNSLGITNNLKVSLLVVDESLITDFVFNNECYLGAELLDTLGVYAETKEILVSTNYSTGWTVEKIQYEASVSSWLTAKKGTGDTKRCNLQLTTKDNPPSADRVAYVHLRAGRLIQKIKVVQKWGPIGMGTLVNDKQSYVGAFWRHNQRGERLIRIPVTKDSKGTWSVQVYDYGGFNEGDILFDTTPTVDPNLTYSVDDNHIDPDEGKYYVDNGVPYISGNAPNAGDYIYFRIGLKNTINADQHRYARIIIYHSNETKYQTLYLRQGEAPDYLMAPGDPTSQSGDRNSNAVRTKTVVKKFSPYNLTSLKLNDIDKIYAKVEVGEGDFTRYPSQAGAAFQFAQKVNPNTAYHPTLTTINGESIPWNSATNQIDDFGPNYNTCPTGYNRYSNTSVNDVTTYQFAQSLQLAPTTHGSSGSKVNCTWGYYADGFFDRLAIENSISNKANSSVRSRKHDVAYIGCLFFNPIESSDKHNSNIFLPAAGYVGSSGSFNAGYELAALSGSRRTSDCHYAQFLNDGSFVTRVLYYAYYGYYIRCVLE